ncbi:MAG: ABC transporter ATP-binding protein/permease [Bacilli bacterium]|nr:ABC transporter ATP-binding protein/permease [Bacilli bacterium]
MWQKIKLILKQVKQYKKFAIMTPLFMIGEALMECCLPFIMSALVDSIDQAESNPGGPLLTQFTDIFKTITYTNANLNLTLNVSVFGIMMVLIGMAIFSLICGILGGRTAAKASVGLGANLRQELYEKIQAFSFANIDKFSTSSLVTRMTTDINNVQMSFQMAIRIVVRAPLMMIFSAIMAFISGGPMAWIFVFLIPVVAISLFLIGRKAMSIFRVLFKRYDALNESVNENVSAIRVVKAYVREDFEKQKFNNASNSMTGEFIRAEKIIALNNPIMNTTIHLSNILIIGLGSYAIYQTKLTDGGFWLKLTVGQMSSLLTYGIQILMNIMMISMILVFMVMSFECINRVGEVLMEEPTIKNPENPVMELADGSVQFNNVNFRYVETAEKNALENINIDIKSGQFIGILGSTGSGKTSLINLISRLYDVSEGSVTVAGHDVREYDLKTLRDNVAVVLQKNVLFSGTLRSNMQWGDKNATDEEITKAIAIAQIPESITAVPEGLDRRVEQGGANFSGGQKQRLCIARAILKKPKIIILDDSTSAVDTKTDKLIRKGLKEDLPEMTKIVIAQRISSIEDADQIIIMDDGKINAIGTHDELIKDNKIYQEIYYTQNRVGGEN